MQVVVEPQGLADGEEVVGPAVLEQHRRGVALDRERAVEPRELVQGVVHERRVGLTGVPGGDRRLDVLREVNGAGGGHVPACLGHDQRRVHVALEQDAARREDLVDRVVVEVEEPPVDEDRADEVGCRPDGGDRPHCHRRPVGAGPRDQVAVAVAVAKVTAVDTVTHHSIVERADHDRDLPTTRHPHGAVAGRHGDALVGQQAQQVLDVTHLVARVLIAPESVGAGSRLQLGPAGSSEAERAVATGAPERPVRGRDDGVPAGREPDVVLARRVGRRRGRLAGHHLDVALVHALVAPEAVDHHDGRPRAISLRWQRDVHVNRHPVEGRDPLALAVIGAVPHAVGDRRAVQAERCRLGCRGRRRDGDGARRAQRHREQCRRDVAGHGDVPSARALSRCGRRPRWTGPLAS